VKATDRLRHKLGKLDNLAVYLAAAVLSLLAADRILRLDLADAHVPFGYGGDALVHAMEVKATVDHGRYMEVPELGAPGVLRLHDHPPQFDSLHLAIVRLMAMFSHDWAAVFNAYYILGFPLIALAALAVLRRLGLSPRTAVVMSLLYAFLPSRLVKAQGHLFLDTFFEVPCAVLLALWACEAEPPLFRDRGPGRWPTLDLRRRRSIAALVLCVLVGATGLYYAFFTVCLIVAGALSAAIGRRSTVHALSGLALAAALGATVAVHALPTALYHARHGANAQVVVSRHPGEAEIFGLRIAQLLLPIDGHRLVAWRALKDRYNATAPFPGESALTSLGVVGGVGFLVLLAVQLGWRRRWTTAAGELSSASRAGDASPPPWRALATLNLVALLLGTVGGFGSLFALLVSPAIRTYCRLNVFIAFLSLAAVGLLIDRLARSRPRLALWLLPVVLGVGLFDQASIHATPSYAQVRAAYEADAELVRRLEAELPPRAMIFQLPFQIFPDAPPIERMEGYDHLRPYLHSRTLRWSYPVMHGRDDEVWIADTSRQPPDKMVRELGAAGFAGVLVDRLGYRDGATALERDLGALLGPPLVTRDGRRAFYRLRAPARSDQGP
jgi:phosphoglycerol transferase